MENNKNPFSLEGKTILVTGASSGIGRETALACARMGASLVITGRNADRLNETFDQLETTNKTQTLADMTNQDDVKSLVASMPPTWHTIILFL